MKSPMLEWCPPTLDEVPVGMVVVSKLNKARYLITGVDPSSGYPIQLGSDPYRSCTAQFLFDTYETLDGSPCGVRR